jgi:hypothetical protein
MFDHLMQKLGRSFNEYRFIIYSGFNANEIDLSSDDPLRTVVLHISDEASSVPYELCRKVRTVFKSYLPNEGIVQNLHSLALGYVESTPDLPPVQITERQQNVFFSGNLNGNRLLLFRVLAKPRISPVLLPRDVVSFLNPGMNCDHFMKSSYIRFTSHFRAGLSGKQYAAHLINSKIALCPQGFQSAETFRHFEAMRAGAIVVSDRLPMLDCYRGSPIICLDDWRNLKSLIRRLLSAPDHLMQIQKETLAWWRDVCSERATAARIAYLIR